MKKLKVFIVLLLMVVVNLNISAQKSNNVITDTIKVSGNCEMCKKTIEKSAKIPGVNKAEWNLKTKKLVLEYDSSKVKNIDVQKKIAASGYETEQIKADEKAYKELPGCCKYSKAQK